MPFRYTKFFIGLPGTLMCSVAVVFMFPINSQAFNPNAGSESVDTTSARPRLPSTAPLITPMPRLTFPEVAAPRIVPQENNAGATITESAATISRPKLAFPETIAQRKVPTENSSITSAPALPPVDEQTARRAAAEIAATPIISTESASPATAGFIPPAPVLAITPPPTTQLGASTSAPEPIGDAPIMAPLPSVLPSHATMPAKPPTKTLSDDSKRILSGVPSQLDTKKPLNGKLKIDRMAPDVKPLASNPKVETFDSGGLSISVRRPGLDSNFELNRAYTALASGDTTTAIDMYKNILSAEPSNEDALFGLAATYHRVGNLEQARPYYATLLKINPNHREGLNNFLALISDESPEEALAELERLEQRNPDFSPIPAQQAALLSKMGYPERARDKILRAIDLAPDNLTYRYNMAVLLDKAGNYGDAAAIYRSLIEAEFNGQKIPAPAASIQKRLNFIAALKPTPLPTATSTEKN